MNLPASAISEDECQHCGIPLYLFEGEEEDGYLPKDREIYCERAPRQDLERLVGISGRGQTLPGQHEPC